MLIIKDWTGKTCFQGRTFDTFEDAWDYIYATDPNPGDDEHWFDDYYVEPVKE